MKAILLMAKVVPAEELKEQTQSLLILHMQKGLEVVNQQQVLVRRLAHLEKEAALLGMEPAEEVVFMAEAEANILMGLVAALDI